MIIDMHTHVGEKQFVSASLKSLEKEMEKSKVTYSVCFVLGDDVEKNSLVLAKECSEKIIPFFRFDPKKISLSQLRQNLKLFKGIKLHPRLENFDPLDSKYAEIFKIIEESKLPVLIHTRKENNPYTDPDRLLELAKLYPYIVFIFGHFANDLKSVIDVIKDLPNIYLETSIVSSPKIIELAVRKCGSEKILFGSDYPMSDQELEVQKVLRADISDEDKENILYRNAMRLIGIKWFFLFLIDFIKIFYCFGN